MSYLRALCALSLLAGLAACDVGDVVVPVSLHAAASAPSALSRVPAMIVDVRDLRQLGGTGLLPGRIGERTAYADVSLGLVAMAPPPGQLVAEALRAELRATGHSVASDGASATIDGDIRQFSIRTPATAIYWDVIGTVAVSVTATSRGQSATGQYTASCQERTYIWPSRDLIARVIGVCVADIARQFRDDPAIARALGG